MPHLFEIAAAILFACRLLLFAALHVWPGGIDTVRDTVSDYATSTSAVTRRLSTTASWVAAAAWAVLGIGILTDAQLGTPRVAVGVWLLVLAGVLAVMPAVPTDGPGAKATARGRLHMLLAIGWFAISYATIGPLARLLDATGSLGFGSTLHVLDIIAAIALGALIVSLVVRPLRTRTFGVSERIFILAVTVAPLVAGLGLAVR